MLDTGSLNYLWSLSIIHAYASAGVQHAVISPGSRSTPITLACDRHADISTWVQVDERSAAFFALGLAINSRQPVILVCTSGSAVANWLPAVVEANYSQVPLILLSADRPEELQNCGANQTIDQQHLNTPVSERPRQRRARRSRRGCGQEPHQRRELVQQARRLGRRAPHADAA